MTSLKIIEQLNNILSNELTAINQYFLHARMLKHAGYMKLADYEYKESIEQMRYADRLVERVLQIGGSPNLHELGKLNIGEEVDNILQGDLKLQEEAIEDLNSAVALCKNETDSASLDILQQIAKNATAHLQFIKEQLNMIDKIGLASYLKTQV